MLGMQAEPKTYKEAMEMLYQALPMFTRIGAAALKPGLDNIRAMTQLLGNPQDQYTTLHVAGTNGKGSTSHCLAAILQVAGYKTGLHTSPHLKHFCERFRVNGLMMPEQDVVAFMQEHHAKLATLQPSFFEYGVLMAFEYFAQQKVDVAIIEVGLGGRLDSTNIIKPALSVITNISWDHADLLGNTLEAIATEKAGIMKADTPVVLGETDSQLANHLAKHANQSGAPFTLATETVLVHAIGVATYKVQLSDGTVWFPALELSLLGEYQQENLATVLTACLELRKLGYAISDKHITDALSQVQSLTGLRGRWHVLSHDPYVVADTGHNVAGISAVVHQLKKVQQSRPGATMHIVMGMVADKDITKVLALLPKEARYYFCQAQIPRALDAEELSRQAAALGLSGIVVKDVNEAYGAALAHAKPKDVILVGGSTFVVAELDALI